MDKKRLTKTISILLAMILLSVIASVLWIIIYKLFGDIGYLIVLGVCLITIAIEIYKVL